MDWFEQNAPTPVAKKRDWFDENAPGKPEVDNEAEVQTLSDRPDILPPTITPARRVPRTWDQPSVQLPPPPADWRLPGPAKPPLPAGLGPENPSQQATMRQLGEVSKPVDPSLADTPLIPFTKIPLPTVPVASAGAPIPIYPKTAPTPPKSIEQVRQEDPNNSAVGAAAGVLKAGEGLTTPRNVGILAAMTVAPPVVAGIASGYFTVDMAKNALESIPEARKAAQEERWGDFAEIVGQGAVSGGMAVTGGIHAAKTGVRAGKALMRPRMAPVEPAPAPAPDPNAAQAAPPEVPPTSAQVRTRSGRLEVQGSPKVVEEFAQLGVSEPNPAIDVKPTEATSVPVPAPVPAVKAPPSPSPLNIEVGAKYRSRSGIYTVLGVDKAGMVTYQFDGKNGKSRTATMAGNEITKLSRVDKPNIPSRPIVEEPSPTVQKTMDWFEENAPEKAEPVPVVEQKGPPVNDQVSQPGEIQGVQRVGEGPVEVPVEARGVETVGDNRVLQAQEGARREVESPIVPSPSERGSVPIEVSVTKEPWQQTKSEYGVPEEPVDTKVQRYPRLEKIFRETPEKVSEADKQLLAQVKSQQAAHNRYLRAHKKYLPKANEHFRAVQKAVEEGKPVPPEILAEYPSLRPRTSETGSVSVDTLTLGAPQFAKEVATGVKREASNIAEGFDEVRKILAPAGRGPSAKNTALVVREQAADLAQRTDRAESALRSARKLFLTTDRTITRDFIDRMENGRPQANPEHQVIADTMRDLLDQRRRDVQALGTKKLKNFIENYFPHIWEQTAGNKQILAQMSASKRPLEGGKSFLKQRTIPTIADGIKAGLTPVSENPVDLVLMKLRETDKYIMAHRTLAELKDRGLVKYFRNSQLSQARALGYAKIDDRIATISLPGTRGGREELGFYMAPEPAARVINNYLSPGLRQYGSFRSYLGLANILNQFQLGMSAFHLGFTSFDASASKFSLGVYQIAHGNPLKGLKSIAASPAAPVTNYLQGSKLLKEWFTPGSQGAEIAKLVDGMKAAGGRARMDRFYETRVTERMVDAFRKGNVLGGLARTPFAAVEAMARPIMENIVPRQKMGVFADLARYELERLGPNANRQQVREALAKAWDSVDNRMGQLVYDNLFWNKAAKDLAMASVRSVGWNLGTIRELGGGITDTAHAVGKGITGQKPDFTFRMSYLAGMPLIAGLYGATFQYLMTGKGPEEMKDYFFPKTGNLDEHGRPERMSLPTYMKDVYHYGTDPGQTIINKLHPIIGLTAEMLNNRDYYGTEIRNADDPFMIQALDTLKHVGTGLTPFAVRGYQKEKERESPGLTRVLPFVGITPAPKSINQSPAEVQIEKYGKERAPVGTRTREEAARTQKIADLTRRMRRGQDITDKFDQAVQEGILGEKDMALIEKRASQTPLENTFEKLNLEEALHVYEQANETEKKKLFPVLEGKIDRAAGNPARKTARIERRLEELGLPEIPDMPVKRRRRNRFEGVEMPAIP